MMATTAAVKTCTEFLKDFDNLVNNSCYWDRVDVYGDSGERYYFSEIYLDYSEKEYFIEQYAAKILESENPTERFYDCLNDNEVEYYNDGYFYDNIIEQVKGNMTEEQEALYELYEDEVREWLYEHCSEGYNTKDFLDCDVDINLMIDTGNANYDFCCDSWVVACDGLPKESSLLWLAKQQQKKTKFVKALNAYMDMDYNERLEGKLYKITDDKFIISMIQEIENIYDYCCTLTFLVKMTLGEAIKLKESMKSKGYITLDKNVECGLFAKWVGGGSVLEIECDKDIKIPLDYIYELQVDDDNNSNQRYHCNYTVGNVYGLSGEAWSEALKEIVTIE